MLPRPWVSVYCVQLAVPVRGAPNQAAPVTLVWLLLHKRPPPPMMCVVHVPATITDPPVPVSCARPIVRGWLVAMRLVAAAREGGPPLHEGPPPPVEPPAIVGQSLYSYAVSRPSIYCLYYVIKCV